MTNEKDTNNKLSSQVKTSSSGSKRVHNIKVGIITMVLIGLILPMIFCIILARQVLHLNKQVDVLIELHKGFDDVSNISKNNNSYAYASETADEALYENNTSNDFNHYDGHDVLDNNDITYLDDQVDNLLIKDEKADQNLDKDKEEIIEESNTALGLDDNKEGKYAGKKVYLTFDDGPSIYTNDILDILNKYDIKATFFVNGKTDQVSKNIYRRIVDEGHILGMHSYSHEYGEIYNSLEEFEKDFTKLWDLLYDVTEYKPTIYRFPGGSLNYVNRNGMDEFIRFLNEKSIQYYDWNVVNGDAVGEQYTKEQLVDNVLNGIEDKKTAIVLMHDARSKLTTVESLPELIEKLISQGATILPLDETVTPIQQIKANSVE